MDDDTGSSGTFYALDFSPSPPSDRFAAAYRELAAEYDPRDILVLKRIPCNLDPVAERIRTAVDLRIRPDVQSVPQHASHVVEIDDPDLDRLSYEQRIELLAGVIESADWAELVDEAESRFTVRWPGNFRREEVVEFFRKASAQGSFGRDLGQILLEATRRGGFTPAGDRHPHILVAVLACLNDRFHARLDEQGLVERANIVPRATEALQRDTTYEQVTARFEAVLALEFEEFTESDRRYLAHLGADAELIAIGERDASVQRIETEPGDLAALRDDCAIDFETGEPPALDDTEASQESAASPGGIASFLATGSEPDGPVSALRLHESTFRGQISAVANEIEYRRHETDGDYRDFAVVVNGLGDRLSEARRRLRATGLPTRTVGAPALAEDPAVAELYAVAQFLLNRDGEASSWLTARVADFSPELAEACESGSLETTMNRWIVNSDLKARVANGENYVESQEQFRNIRRVTDLARFIDGTGLLDSDLQTFRHVLQRAIRFDATYTHTIETDPRMHGITVTDIQGIKHRSYETVFLLDVVDSEYPGGERLTPLFPNPWLTDMPAYPAVTHVDADTIADTYTTGSDERSTSPFDAYYHHRERRKLALGARAATKHLYFCTYDSRENGLGRAYNPSRYLSLLEQRDGIEVDDLSLERSERPVRTREKVAESVLDQPWSELEAIVNAAHTGESAELEETEEVFGVIQGLLSGDDVDPVFADAVASQFATARGEVIRGD